MPIRNPRLNEYGFSLLEVLLALTIAGIFLAMSLTLMADQWRGSKSLKYQLELRYSLLNAGRAVSDAIRSAKTVQWDSPGVLKVLPWPDTGSTATDLYYISDKDRDGITDLYCEHLNVANPVAMYISDLQGTEVEPGLWKIYLKASFGQATAVWETHIRQRTN
ncbi:MAG: prepilin-type N-terminal cleavage/methylation domain-containing protein [Desulfitobacterium hafniense]|nr:prepilin-type N-terminal cleavage/methylation domain-containing protein [Desulfitobacterium hafniense]